MTIKRFPNKSDFNFLAPLWDLVKNPRNGLLCGYHIPEMMTANGFQYGNGCWSHIDFYGLWFVNFHPELEILWVGEACKEIWEDPIVLKIESPSEMEAACA